MERALSLLNPKEDEIKKGAEKAKIVEDLFRETF
ncbi:hypothetical protein Arcpr_1776 [Archaeoglobus profundus DSM 5631]|uniref:Uncharacterized protein n=1 Tax=Archaeoglobus profundus (strain DSM 5631 / JCM 9629 / NBRC 100127 / Av18) TaxID=572546 RepID=D2RFC6_ARCPA|nr:hypothetical protein Arcpr_1776 [Archaeoglobus profundus DSM 5631]